MSKLPYQVNAARMGHDPVSVGPMGVRDLEALHRASGLDVHNRTVFGTPLLKRPVGPRADQTVPADVTAAKAHSIDRKKITDLALGAAQPAAATPSLAKVALAVLGM